MNRLPRRLISGFLLAALLAALLSAPAAGQFFPPRPPADVQQAPPSDRDYPPRDYPPQQQRPLPPPQQRPLPPPEQRPLPPPEQRPLPPPQQRELPPQRQPDVPPPAEKKRPPAKQKAKDQQQPQQPETPETMTQPEGEHIAHPTATFSGLDKISGRIITFDVALNETVQFGALQVTPRACYKRPPTETQNTTAFVEVDEITLKAEIKRIFTGWMFASSPGLNAVQHPIYDIWLIDCKTTPPSITPSDGQQ